MEPLLEADASALRLRLPSGVGVLDVFIDGHRVWSFDPTDYEKGKDGWRTVEWPSALSARLDGTSEVDVRDHIRGEVVIAAVCRFGDSPGPVDLTDRYGRLLSLSKWGRLNQSFADLDDEVKDWYLDRVGEVLSVLTNDLRLPAFLSYGSLLGAIRSQHFIGHDMDVDLGYASEAQTPVDVMRESFAVERHLRRRGWPVLRQNGGFLQVFFRQPDGGSRNIDVFTLWSDRHMERLYEINDISCQGSLADVLPVRSEVLEGRRLPVPRRSEVLLQAAYGPSWRIPDPNFSYGMTADKRQMREWFGGLREDRDSWNRFFRQQMRTAPKQRSGFSEWVAASLDGQVAVVDVGCGAGRDVSFYARSRRRVAGLDVSSAAVARARRRLARRAREVQVRRLNLGSMREVLATGALLARSLPGPRAVVGSHLIDAMGEAAFDNFWVLCRGLLDEGGRCLLQFTVPPGPDEFREYPGMRARRLDPAMVAGVAAGAGFTVEKEERVEGPEGASCRMILTRAEVTGPDTKGLSRR